MQTVEIVKLISQVHSCLDFLILMEGGLQGALKGRVRISGASQKSQRAPKVHLHDMS